MSNTEVTKITINVANENYEAVRNLAKKQHTNMTTIINKAIHLESLVDNTIRAGGRVIFEKADGTREVVILR